MKSGTPVYRLHALDMGNLNDKMPSAVVSASHTLSDGHTVLTFNAPYQRQRPGLLLANGNIYAGFGSLCDWGGSNPRGWVLGWNATTLASLAANQINDTQTSEPHGMFLSSVWTSGSSLAADDTGNIYFVTGNSDKTGTTYDGVTNIQERRSQGVTKSYQRAEPVHAEGSAEPGCGGYRLRFGQRGAAAHRARDSGQFGGGSRQEWTYILDLSSLGGKSATGIGGTPVSIGYCWCAQSTFSDGTEHLVSSGASTVMLWDIKPSPVSIMQAATSAGIGEAQDGGLLHHSFVERSGCRL